jgi:glycosyltransferase involved in cell wall biosynthesis
MKAKWRIAYVCPRYSPRSAGGAEILIQSWAERMRQRGHHSEVLTTCARDHITWENEFKEGTEDINGITVRRFPVNSRDPEKQEFYQNKINSGRKLTRPEEEEWIKAGANSDSLCEYIRDHQDEFDAIIFAPYLFGVTYFGLRIAPEKSILVPCLHNEPYAYLKIFHDLFHLAAGAFFNSRAELMLARRLMGLKDERSTIVGMGIDSVGPQEPLDFRKKFGIDSPFLLYAGRREGGKNTPLLLDYFRAFKRYQDTELILLLMGTGEIKLSGRDKGAIKDIGFVSEEDKWNGYSASTAFCQPSTNESFSIVLLESWLAGKPALVNAFCPVTFDHCRSSGGGIYFRDYYEFEESLFYFLSHPRETELIGRQGQKYVQENYSWEKVLDRLEEGIKKCLKCLK